MPREPLNLFSAAGDAAGVRQLLLTRFPHAEVTGNGADWTAIAVPFPDSRRVTVLHDRGYYTGAKWATQKAGMGRYFAQWPQTGDRRDRLTAAVQSFRFALATRFEPDYDPTGDDRLSVVTELAAALDGVLFSPSVLRDARFRVLAAADGGVDADAEWPAVELVSAPGGVLDPLRVARRAVALLLLTNRGLLERDAGASPFTVTNYARLLEWADELGIDDEFEPWERAAVHTPPGELDPQTAANAGWRVEGLAMLAWALYRAELPPANQTADVDATWTAVGFFHDAKVKELWANPIVRPQAELEAYRQEVGAEYRRLLADDSVAARTGLSIAFERSLAIHWLCRGPAVYSDADIG